MLRRAIVLSVGLIVLGSGAAFAQIVPPFPPIDLTGLGNTWTGADGVIWNESITSPTGTGVYNPFLRLQNDPTEQGFNTNYGGPADNVGSDKPPLDDKGGVWTRAIQMQNIGTVTKGGIDYYQFTLDINEPGTYPEAYLSLDEVKIYTVAAGVGMDKLATWSDVVSNGTLRYDMDGTANQEVYLDANLQQGSGHDDMEMLIPVTKFGTAAATDYMYFYSAFGGAGLQWQSNKGLVDATGSESGFEEWHALQGTTPPPNIPEPSVLLMLGGGLFGLIGSKIRQKN